MYCGRCQRKSVQRVFLKKNNIIVSGIIIAVILAACISIPLRNLQLSVKTIYCISMPGKIVMNLLKLMILPLLVFSLLSGLTSLNMSTSGKLGLYTVLYYMLTTFVAMCLGMFLVTVIHPGSTNIGMAFEQNNKVIDPVESILDLFNNLFPDNFIRSSFQTAEIHFINESRKMMSPNSHGNISVSYKQEANMSYVYSPNYLGVIFFSIFLGIILNTMGSKAQLLVTLINILNDLTMKMMETVFLIIPLGIFFVLLGNLLDVQDMGIMLRTIGWFVLTVIIGLVIHTFLLLPLIYAVFTRKNPYIFMMGMARAMVVAIVTDSSSAALPATMACAEKNNKIDPRITKFMLPLGAIINMDGTGLYEAVAAIFIAQINGIHLSALQVIRISFTSTLAAIGGAPVPSAGLVTLLIVLSTASLPTHQVSLLYTFDWLLDRSRTSMNVLGDAFGTGIIQKFCEKDLKRESALDMKMSNKDINSVEIV